MAEWNKFQKFFENRNVEKCAFHLIPHLRPDSKIIDIGCGVGTITRDFARRCPQGSVVGIDSSEQAIVTAKEAAQKEGLTNVEFVVGDVEDLGQYPDNNFDVVHAHQVMIHLVHPVKSLVHARRIVKAGGVVGIRDNAFHDQPGCTALMHENLQKFWQGKRDSGARGPDAGRVNHTWMHEAGFPWDRLTWNCTGLDNPREEFSAIAEGQIAFAELRGESEDYVTRLRKDWEESLAKPGYRGIMLDGWVVGVK